MLIADEVVATTSALDALQTAAVADLLDRTSRPAASAETFGPPQEIAQATDAVDPQHAAFVKARVGAYYARARALEALSFDLLQERVSEELGAGAAAQIAAARRQLLRDR